MEKDRPPDTVVTTPANDDQSDGGRNDSGEPIATPPLSGEEACPGDASKSNINGVNAAEKNEESVFINEIPIDTNTPIRILNISAKSPTTPMTGETKDYRRLYHEMRRRVVNLTESNASNLTRTKEELDELRTNYEIIKSENKELKERIAEKDKALLSITKQKDDSSDLVAALKAQNSLLTSERDRFKKASESKVELKRRGSEEMIKSKSKAKKAIAEGQGNLVCEFPGCDNKNEDALIKCNSCGKWICETCSEARITKLKPCITNCATIFFACSKCVDPSGDPGISYAPQCQAKQVPPAPEELVTSMKSILKDHVTNLESTIESLIDKKLNEKLPSPAVSEPNSATEHQESYARKVLRVPEELRKIILEAKNDDKVEESEQEKRATNFIIHGAEEFGETTAEMKALDNDYVDDILKQLGMHVTPESVIRVGASNESKSRPIKVTMKSKADKQKIMSRLSRLKGTEEEFGKISITEDYTKTERDLIKSWNANAKKKSSEDDKYDYKVRGDPKNGLRLIRVKKRV